MAAELVVVVGGGTGVGTSTLAALLARRRVRTSPPDARVALVDLGQGTGGVEVLLGIEGRPGVRWPALRDVRGTLDGDDLVGVLPLWEGVEVLSGDRRGAAPGAGPAVATVLQSLVTGCSTVVVDLPAHQVGVHDLTPPAGATHVVVVTGQDVLGVAGAMACREAVTGLARDLDAGTHLVLRRRRRARVAPAEVAHVLATPLAGMLPTGRHLRESVDRGFGPVPGAGGAVRRAVDRIDRCLDGAP